MTVVHPKAKIFSLKVFSFSLSYFQICVGRWGQQTSVKKRMIFQANAIFMKSSKEKAQITAGRFGDFIANLKGISVTKLGYPKVHV